MNGKNNGNGVTNGVNGNSRKMSIPRPRFISCDETSLKLNIEYKPPIGTTIILQYKEPPENWSAAREIPVPIARKASVPSSSIVTILTSELVDLKPGSAYFVRVGCRNNSTGTVEYGTESVFDTKPIDCGPKRKKCSIS